MRKLALAACAVILAALSVPAMAQQLAMLPVQVTNSCHQTVSLSIAATDQFADAIAPRQLTLQPGEIGNPGITSWNDGPLLVSGNTVTPAIVGDTARETLWYPGSQPSVIKVAHDDSNLFFWGNDFIVTPGERPEMHPETTALTGDPVEFVLPGNRHETVYTGSRFRPVYNPVAYTVEDGVIMVNLTCAGSG